MKYVESNPPASEASLLWTASMGYSEAWVAARVLAVLSGRSEVVPCLALVLWESTSASVHHVSREAFPNQGGTILDI